MKQSINRNNTYITLIEYIFVITTVLYNSVYSASANIGPIFTLVSNSIWQISLITILFITLFNMYDGNNNIILLFCLSFFILVSLLLFMEYLRFPFSKILILKLLFDPLILVFCFYKNKFFYKSFFYMFVKVVSILAFISLILWGLLSVGIPATSVITVRWGNIVDTRSLFLFIQALEPYKYSFLGMHVFRNIGIFFEAPMYSYVLTIAILCNLFVLRHKIFSKDNIILLIANITTFSTTGAIFSIIFILCVLFLRSHGIYYFFLLFISVIFVFLIKILFISKKSLGNSDNPFSSYNIRANDITASLNAWYHHLFLGCGINNTHFIMNYMNPVRVINNTNNIGVTTGLGAILAYGGIALFMYYIIPSILLLYSKNFYTFGFSIFSILILISVYAQFSYICIIAISFSWAISLKLLRNDHMFLSE